MSAYSKIRITFCRNIADVYKRLISHAYEGIAYYLIYHTAFSFACASPTNASCIADKPDG